MQTRWTKLAIVVLMSLAIMAWAKTAPAEGTVKVGATLTPTTFKNFCAVIEGRYVLDFHLKFEPKEALREGDALRFGFPNLFTDDVTSYERSLSPEQVQEAAAQVWLSPSDVNLAPASYYVRVDVLRNGESLCGPNMGSCELYVCREGESVRHALGSFFISRVVYSWGPKRKAYYLQFLCLPGPATGDPFGPEEPPEGLKPLKTYGWGGDSYTWQPWKLISELLHGGGEGFMYAAQVFRKTGEMDRAPFCDTVLKRTLEAALKYLLAEDGKLYHMFICLEDGNITTKLAWPDAAGEEEEGWLLELFSQSDLHFRDVVGDRAYADSLFHRMQPLVKQMFQRFS